MNEILWQPTPAQIAEAKVSDFRRRMNEHFGLDLADYAQLYAWSVAEPARFWEGVWRFCDIIASRDWDAVLVDGDRLPGTRWFPGARLNFAENLLRFREDREALVFRGEDGSERRFSQAELHHETARLAQALRAAGVQVGDRVAGFLPNLPETVIAMLATASLGALWSSCSPDFGVEGVLDRFGQIAPRILFAADGYLYHGHRHDSLARIRRIQSELPSLEKIVLVPFTSDAPDLSGLPHAILWADFLAPLSVRQIEFAQLPFDHPLYIMFSSGTTGLPKCLVHGAGGTLLQHLKEHVLHGDLRPGDRIFYYTTCGWMMWNWLVSALACGARVLLYDGSPTSPTTVLWDIAAKERIDVFGTSAKYLAACEKRGLKPRATHDLAPLRCILSTGSPLAPESFDYVYRDVKPDVRLSSISGGTDIISCFALGNPVLPVRRGELQGRGLGMKVEVFDDAGRPLVGAKGELVCTAPFPSMPLGFWNDPDGAKYHASYFARYPGIWHHADWAELRPEGGLVIYGRSDAVLNPGGVRIGTAEIYRVVEKFAEVLESIVVGQEWRGDVRVVLFVHLRNGLELTDDLRRRIQAAIRDEETPRHVPARIVQVAAIPRTISGKIVELAVREVIHGRPVKNRDALANPAALDLFKDLPELAAD
jgi:acetoacetyl-CoA synthetase